MLNTNNFVEYHPGASPSLWLTNDRFKGNPMVLSAAETHAIRDEKIKWLDFSFEAARE